MHMQDWIEIDPFYRQEMALRKAILANHRSTVIGRVGGERKRGESAEGRGGDAGEWEGERVREGEGEWEGERVREGEGDWEGARVREAEWELLHMLANFLPSRYPDIFSLSHCRLHNHATGDSFDLSDTSQDPLEIISQLIQEDVCLMIPCSTSSTSPSSSSHPSTSSPSTTPPLYLVSGAVLFPNGWILPEKLGLPTAQIHGPVPLYESTISRAVNKFLNNLQPGSPFSRSNWTITDDPRLFRPISEASYASLVQLRANMGESSQQTLEQGHPAEGQAQEQPQSDEEDPITVENAGWKLFTRSERETFVRLPETGAVLFTIRTHMKPLRVFSGRRQLAADVAQAMDALPSEMRWYKMIGGRLADVAREYLLRCSQGIV
ncbi:hypothetical protein CLOM_g75 [Closterium sp. NIES-68]|nr:hypothetical protein CLOM_g75 [Closterium sp. NIES-68]